jgi:PhzF family phenazine biosynthesis protein
VQECGAGLVPVRRSDAGLCFAAPPPIRSGAVEDQVLARLERMLGVDRAAMTDTQWVDNGPGWVAVLLEDPEQVLALTPSFDELDVGVVAPYPPGSPEAFEVRAFTYRDGHVEEDPVTGSLNASLAQWLLATGRATAPYVSRQGTALGRAGRVHVTQDDDGAVWAGGGTVTCIRGEVDL